MEDLFNVIAQADRERLKKMMTEIMHRWAELHSDWELVCVTLPKYDLREREETLRATFRVLLKMDYNKLERQLESENV